jgi:radical SAM superfamily enzyme YgiQ (UPF0313 family)
MGFLHIASVLQETGIDVDILDLNALRNSFSKTKKIINSKQFHVVGIGGMTTIYYYLKLISLYLKLEYPNIPIIGGGSVCSSTPETVLNKTGVDVAVIGEGEPIIVSLVQALVSNGDLSVIPGIYYCSENGEIRKTSARGRLRGLSNLPYPSYELVDMELYIKNNAEKYADSEELNKVVQERGLDPIRARRPFPLYTKRGCPYSCNFCYRNFGRQVYNFSVGYLIEQIEYISTEYNTIHFVFGDELWNVNKKRCIEFCERIVKDGNKYVFSLSNSLRANLIDRPLLEAMKAAGFVRIGIGIESFYNPTLKAMNKKQDAETIYEAIKLDWLSYDALWLRDGRVRVDGD